MDLGTKSVRDVLVEKLGAEKADSVLKKINDGYAQGKRGDDLKNHAQSVLSEEGVERSLDISDVYFAAPV